MSDYFKSMLSGRFAETEAPSIDLSDCFNDVNELNIVLDFMYTGSISLSKGNISSVVNTASLFLMNDLQTSCSEFLIANIAPSTCISILILAERYSLQRVQDGCVEVIRAWFPFGLCESQEALKMPPDCLTVLLEEKVFELMPDQVKKNFLQKWHEGFRERCSGKENLSGDIAALLKAQLFDSQSAKQPSQASWFAEDGMKEVLLTIVNPIESDSKFIEILAFVPEIKTWKLFLRHEFSSEVVESRMLGAFVGVSKKAAFFVFESEDGDQSKGCVVSVDLETRRESLINPPESLQKPLLTKYFLWGLDLCAFSSNHDGGGLFYKSNHDSTCRGKCIGRCWVSVGQLPNPTIRIKDDEFVTKVFQDKLYVWLLSGDFDERGPKFFCIARNPNKIDKWLVLQLGSPPGKFEDNPFFDFGPCSLSHITVDWKTSSLKFVSQFDGPADFPEVDTSHIERAYSYDVERNQWKGVQYYHVEYPVSGI